MKVINTVSVIVGILLALPASAEVYYSKDWIWGNNEGDYLYAATSNSKEHFFGQYCYLDSNECYYLVSMNTSCDVDDEYPALVNSNAGSAHVTLICSHKYEGSYVFKISPFDEMDSLVRKANQIGIAVPMQSDKFKVSRFSMIGSTKAIDKMRSTTRRILDRKGRRTDNPDEQYL